MHCGDYIVYVRVKKLCCLSLAAIKDEYTGAVNRFAGSFHIFTLS